MKRLRIELKDNQSRPWRPPWQIHAIVILVGVALYPLTVIGPHSYGWAMSIVMAVGSVAFAGFRMRSRFSDPQRFWKTILLILFLQIPLVIAIRPLIERYKLQMVFVFAISDCFFAALVLDRASSTSRDS